MLCLYGALFPLALSAICFGWYNWYLKGHHKTDFNVGGTILLAVGIIVGAIGFITTGIAYVSQVDDFEDVKKFQKVESIYQAKAKTLTAEFVKYLAQVYPEHEKNMYDNISPEKVDLYFVKYPEIRSSETLTTLVAQINKLQSDIYDQQIAVEQALKNTRSRLRNPWLLAFMLPTE
ncbi:MAG: hypothetical protein PF572_04530 [Patescibacteria group bacterium]|jgi:hypothetical protein|nr:hypothetical protein [Patescibacteria group bacterium]